MIAKVFGGVVALVLAVLSGVGVKLWMDRVRGKGFQDGYDRARDEHDVLAGHVVSKLAERDAAAEQRGRAARDAIGNRLPSDLAKAEERLEDILAETNTPARAERR